jgi:photosystem II stability/assembly factor-like uncharacterized protein
VTAALFAIAVVGSLATAAGSATPAAAHTTSALQAVACPTVSACVAVGGSGHVLVSGDGGATWSNKTVPTKHFLYDVGCGNASRCVAVGDAGTAVVSRDAGKSWRTSGTGVSVALSGVSCTGPQQCVAVGDSNTVITTTDGGSSWSRSFSQLGVMDGVSCASAAHCAAVTSNANNTFTTSNGTTWATTPGPFSALAVLKPANGIDCVAAACVEVADHGLVAHSANQGATWAASPSGTVQNLYDVSCVSQIACVAVGAAGTDIHTSDGGASWAAGTTGTNQNLLGVSCSGATSCVAVGSGGTVLSSSDGGTTWTHRLGAPAPAQLRVLVVGDSFSGTLTEGLARNSPAYGMTLSNGSLDGCALARGGPILENGQPYDQGLGPCAATGTGWEGQYQASVAAVHPALTVLVLGPFDLSTRQINGQYLAPGQSAYDTYFRSQVASALQILTADGSRVVVTTAPFVHMTGPEYCAPLPASQAGCPSLAARVSALDAAAQQAAAGFAGKVTFVKLGQRLAPHDKFVGTINGVVVRAADGVHLTEAAGEWLGPWLLPQLAAAAGAGSSP